jgi:lipopolysaccharide export system protein LptC
VTEALRVYPSENLAITDNEVNIFTATTETSAGGLRANLDQDEFAFRSSDTQRVTTTIHLLASPAVD